MAQAAVDAILHAATSATNGPAGIVFGAINSKGDVLAKSASGVRKLGGEGKDNVMQQDTVFCIFSCTKVSESRRFPRIFPAAILADFVNPWKLAPSARMLKQTLLRY